MIWVVILEQWWRGACIGSTEDLIEAADAAEAEELAITAWRALRPDLTFAPLLTAKGPRPRA